jgi:pyridoxine/pyridoxamine 5'-phosphate oxidase
MNESIWNHPVTAEEVLRKAFDALETGARNRRHAFHQPVFSTMGEIGPESRMVVLRRFWNEPPRLAFHTHVGSPKISDIERNPNVSWVFYDDEAKFQVRVHGIASVHRDDGLADEQWNKTNPFPRRCYVGEAPGRESDEPVSGLPDYVQDTTSDFGTLEEGRPNFVVVSSTIESMDCLELDARGHRRCRFRWDGGNLKDHSWLTP